MLCPLRPLFLYCQGKEKDYNLSISNLTEFLYVKKALPGHWG